MLPSQRPVAVVGGIRLPFARAFTDYASASNQELLTAALTGLVERFALSGERLGEVVAGSVLKHSRDHNLARECVLGTRLDPQTPAYDVQQACCAVSGHGSAPLRPCGHATRCPSLRRTASERG